MSGMIHTESSPALKRGPYAVRWRVWPPEGFTEPTADELEKIRKIVNNRIAYGDRSFSRTKLTGAEILRRLQVIEWFHGLPWVSTPAALGYIRDLRRWLAAEPGAPVFVSLRRPRCSMCSHASDRLWEATGETHNIVDRNDEPIKSAFVCARCWSDYMIDEEE